MVFLIVFVVGFLVGMYWQRSQSVAMAKSTSQPAMRDVTDFEVEELLRKGRKLEAIKRYREIHACDIATAQHHVDTLEAILKL